MVRHPSKQHSFCSTHASSSVGVLHRAKSGVGKPPTARSVGSIGASSALDVVDPAISEPCHPLRAHAPAPMAARTRPLALVESSRRMQSALVTSEKACGSTSETAMRPTSEAPPSWRPGAITTPDSTNRRPAVAKRRAGVLAPKAPLRWRHHRHGQSPELKTSSMIRFLAGGSARNSLHVRARWNCR